jgi:excisionase family DNA binding protein
MTSLAVSVEEAASLFGVHPETVRREIRKGRLPAVRIGRRTLVAREVLNKLLSGSRVGGAA